MNCRKLSSTKPSNNAELKCAIDHILDAQKKGEINEDNVLYIVENINVAGTYFHFISYNYNYFSFNFEVSSLSSLGQIEKKSLTKVKKYYQILVVVPSRFTK